MDKVKPTFAIPFASNHCHLHRDVLEYNDYVTNPLRLQEDLKTLGGLESLQLVIMPPGSWYSSQSGFSLTSLEPFRNFAGEIQLYAARKKETLENYYSEEESTKIPRVVFERLLQQIHGIPFWLRWYLSGLKVVFCLRFGTACCSWHVLDCQRLMWTHLDEEPQHKPGPVIDIPALLFKDVVFKRMFAHAGISKRVRYHCASLREWQLLQRFLFMLVFIEHRVFPLKARYLKKLLQSYRQRWREVYVYALAAYLHWVKRDPLWKVEEKLLLRS
jgi:UDP-MurNAc hydroxylase